MYILILPCSCLCVRLINFNVEFSCGKNITIATCLRFLFFALKCAHFFAPSFTSFVGFSTNSFGDLSLFIGLVYSFLCLLVLNFILFFISLNLLFRIVRIPLFYWSWINDNNSRTFMVLSNTVATFIIPLNVYSIDWKHKNRRFILFVHYFKVVWWRHTEELIANN